MAEDHTLGHVSVTSAQKTAVTIKVENLRLTGRSRSSPKEWDGERFLASR